MGVRMPRLTERRQMQTRNEILDAALALFREHGFEATSVAQIAEAAGVSRRTVYRYYPVKDDLIFEFPRRWYEMFDQDVSKREPGESVRSMARRAYLNIAKSIDGDADRVLAAFTIVTETESLRGRHGRTDDLNAQRLVELMLAEPGAEPDQLLKYILVARCMIAANNAALTTWTLGYPSVDVVAEVNRAHDMLDPLWPEVFI